MIVSDPGHHYELQVLDGTEEVLSLVFVKREGPKFHGNSGHHAGTNMQDVLRAVLHRISYLDEQEHDDRNELAAGLIGHAIWLFEQRAAERHHRPTPNRLEAIFGEPCGICGHVGCIGECHEG
jgi:hypothetical protein